MSIVVYQSRNPLSAENVRLLPMQSASRDWSGAPLAASFSWCFAHDPKVLWFMASLPGGQHFNGSHASGEFIEGLWEQDVVEFFVKDEGGRYQEFNISPAGAWWTTSLGSYRTREEATPELQLLKVETDLQERAWTALFAVAHSGLAVSLNSRASLHVSGIAHKPTRQFLSSNPVAAVEPDFHRPETFQLVELRNCP